MDLESIQILTEKIKRHLERIDELMTILQYRLEFDTEPYIRM
jgi:hypothetical protein